MMNLVYLLDCLSVTHMLWQKFVMVRQVCQAIMCIEKNTQHKTCKFTYDVCIDFWCTYLDFFVLIVKINTRCVGSVKKQKSVSYKEFAFSALIHWKTVLVSITNAGFAVNPVHQSDQKYCQLTCLCSQRQNSLESFWIGNLRCLLAAFYFHMI